MCFELLCGAPNPSRSGSASAAPLPPPAERPPRPPPAVGVGVPLPPPLPPLPPRAQPPEQRRPGTLPPARDEVAQPQRHLREALPALILLDLVELLEQRVGVEVPRPSARERRPAQILASTATPSSPYSWSRVSGKSRDALNARLARTTGRPLVTSSNTEYSRTVRSVTPLAIRRSAYVTAPRGWRNSRISRRSSVSALTRRRLWMSFSTAPVNFAVPHLAEQAHHLHLVVPGLLAQAHVVELDARHLRQEVVAVLRDQDLHPVPVRRLRRRLAERPVHRLHHVPELPPEHLPPNLTLDELVLRPVQQLVQRRALVLHEDRVDQRGGSVPAPVRSARVRPLGRVQVPVDGGVDGGR